jgi:hypothetical protein
MAEPHKGMTRLAPGVYTSNCGGALHIFVDELLVANGFGATDHNRQVLVDVARETLVKTFPGIPLVIRDE